MDTCKECPFGGIKVGTRGDPSSPLVIVGESPGAEEIRCKQPFIGPSGKLLYEVLPHSVPAFVTNAICCKPPKDKTPKRLQEAITACRQRLLNEIGAYPHKVIIALGGAAAQALTGDYSLKITQVRGQIIASNLASCGIVLAVHPAFLLRGGGNLKQFKEDIKKALELLKTGRLKRLWREPIIIPNYYQLITQCPKSRLIAADIETSGFSPRKDRILSVGFADVMEPAKVFITDNLDIVNRIIKCSSNHFIWHNGKFDISFLRAAGIPAKVDEDTMLLSYALNEYGGMHDLEQKMFDLLGAPKYKNALDPYLPNKQTSYEVVPKDILWKYQAKDVCGTAMIYPILKEKVDRDPDLNKLYYKVLLPASELLTAMETRGLYVDDIRVAENEITLSSELLVKKQELRELIGWELNPNSPQQVAHFIYDQLRLRGRNRSTSKETLRDMSHPAIMKILEFRTISKVLGTYVRGAMKRKDSDGRIRSTYLLHATTTGRLSSRNPNLQNIPRDPKLKGMFIAAPSYVYIEADYSQAELRSLAILSQDKFLCEIYTSTNRSLHKEVALQRFGEGYSSYQYIRAKAVNFGIVYGRTAKTISDEFHISIDEAQKDIDTWFERAPQAREFILMCRRAPLQGRVMTTCFGRKRRFQLVSNNNIHEVQNQAANFPHQSIASDCTLMSAVELDPILSKKGVLIVNLIHDSILVECLNDPGLISWTKEIMNKVMIRKPIEWGLTLVPFKVDFTVGKRWGSLK